jgi:hypothetical protein
MDKQRNYSLPGGKIIGYEVDVVNGKLCETPVYEQGPTPTLTEASIEDQAPHMQQPPIVERAESRTRNFRGKSLASASIFFASLAGVMYVSDAGSTFVKEHRIISPLDAYEDFTELPGLIGPAIEKIQTVAKVING